VGSIKCAMSSFILWKNTRFTIRSLNRWQNAKNSFSINHKLEYHSRSSQTTLIETIFGIRQRWYTQRRTVCNERERERERESERERERDTKHQTLNPLLEITKICKSIEMYELHDYTLIVKSRLNGLCVGSERNFLWVFSYYKTIISYFS